jgi:hypothetical protein
MATKPRHPVRRAGRTFIATLFLGAALAVPSAALATQPAPDHKVTICHRTNSNTNPYVEETVDIASSGHLQGGHDTQHEGPVWNPTLKDQKIEWGDIIPPYTYGDFSYPGQNMAAGSAILEAGCAVESQSDEPSDDPSEPVETESVPVQTPEGSVESETGTPHEGLTPPPTDTFGDGGQTSDPTTVLLLLAALALGVGLSADRARSRAKGRR